MSVIPTIRRKPNYKKPPTVSTGLKLGFNAVGIRLLDDSTLDSLKSIEVGKLKKRARLKNVNPDTSGSSRILNTVTDILNEINWTGHDTDFREVAFQMARDAFELNVLTDDHHTIEKALLGVFTKKEDPMVVNAVDILARSRPKAIVRESDALLKHPNPEVVTVVFKTLCKRNMGKAFRAFMEKAEHSPTTQTILMMLNSIREGVSIGSMTRST
ncbi:MAG: hypothetical protein ABIG39_05025, partial [Candidatus Micrarchaeota archaeon]